MNIIIKADTMISAKKIVKINDNTDVNLFVYTDFNVRDGISGYVQDHGVVNMFKSRSFRYMLQVFRDNKKTVPWGDLLNKLVEQNDTYNMLQYYGVIEFEEVVYADFLKLKMLINTEDVNTHRILQRQIIDQAFTLDGVI